MTALLWILAGIAAWAVLATLLALLLGRFIAAADRRSPTEAVTYSVVARSGDTLLDLRAHTPE